MSCEKNTFKNEKKIPALNVSLRKDLGICQCHSITQVTMTLQYESRKKHKQIEMT